MKKEYISPEIEIEIVGILDVCIESEFFAGTIDTSEPQGEWIW